MSRVADYLIEREEAIGRLYRAGWIDINEYDELIDALMVYYGYID